MTLESKRLNRSDDFPISLSPMTGQVIASRGDKILASSDRALILYEPRHYPAVYFPREDVDLNQFERTAHLTQCPYKGDASYWRLKGDPEQNRQSAWSYEDPPARLKEIKDYVAFYSDKVALTFESDEAYPGVFIPGYGEQRPISENKLLDWIVREAWSASTTRELLLRFVREVERIGIPLVRVNIVLRTMHPLLVARGYRWWRREYDTVHRFDAGHEIIDTDEYLRSPIRHVLDGYGALRRKIRDVVSDDEFDIITDLREAGATDYIAIPMLFSNGQQNAFTLATDCPGGFPDSFLTDVLQILPTLSRCFEVHSQRRDSVTLLETFLGKNTGERVLNGNIRRGDGDDIFAVIWFSDLRGSTPIADSMTREEFLAYLNVFFDAMAGSVVEKGGEVLRFVGDAVLAIFPTEKHDKNNDQLACGKAIEAARLVKERVAHANMELVKLGKPEIDYGIGLHLGSVTYGNIGIPERLEFTVIGAAANEASRVESMSKVLNKNVVVSSALAHAFDGELVSLGHHTLRGIREVQELFTLPEEADTPEP